MKSKFLLLSALVALCSACSSGSTQAVSSVGYNSGGSIGGSDEYYPDSQTFGIDEYEYVIWE